MCSSSLGQRPAGSPSRLQGSLARHLRTGPSRHGTADAIAAAQTSNASSRHKVLYAQSLACRSQPSIPQPPSHVAAASLTRRQTLQALAASAVAIAVPGSAVNAAEAVQEDVQVTVCCVLTMILPADHQLALTDLQFKTLSYPTLAFEFDYPVTTASGRKLPVIVSRKPERYSSAAPMTADARQRIVTELVDFPDGITISVSVSPARLLILHAWALVSYHTYNIVA